MASYTDHLDMLNAFVAGDISGGWKFLTETPLLNQRIIGCLRLGARCQLFAVIG